MAKKKMTTLDKVAERAHASWSAMVVAIAGLPTEAEFSAWLAGRMAPLHERLRVLNIQAGEAAQILQYTGQSWEDPKKVAQKNQAQTKLDQANRAKADIRVDLVRLTDCEIMMRDIRKIRPPLTANIRELTALTEAGGVVEASPSDGVQHVSVSELVEMSI